MVNTQPKFNVTFKELAVLAIQRQQRGSVVMILKDETAEIDKVVYKGLGEVKKADYTAENYDRLTITFEGLPKKAKVNLS